MSEPWRQRVALVVGIDKYSSNPLKNAAKDARAVEHVLLKEAGFDEADVCCIIDPDRSGLMKEVRKFKTRIKNSKGLSADQGCLALFYYAGHGLIDSKGRHHMLAADYEVLDGDVSFALDAFGCKLDTVLECFQDAYAGIVLIDACQDLQQLQDIASRGMSDAVGVKGRGSEPAQRGWGGDAIGTEHHAQNLLVGHSCAPRRGASDGVGQGTYTDHLVRELCNPAYPHVVDALLAVNVKVYKATQGSKFPQQPRLDLSAKPALFDSFRLERLPKDETARLSDYQDQITDSMQGLSDPIQRPSDPSSSLGAKGWTAILGRREHNGQQLLRHISDAASQSERESCLNLIVDLEGVPLLLGVLKEEQKHTSEELRRTTCSILAHLAATPQHREVLIAKGAGPLLLQEFGSYAARPANSVHAVAAEVLQTLMASKTAKASIVRCGGVAQLIECLKTCFDNKTEPSTGASWAPEGFEYASTALQLLSDLCDSHCYMLRARRLAAEAKLQQILQGVQQHKLIRERDPLCNGGCTAKVLKAAKELSTLLESDPKFGTHNH